MDVVGHNAPAQKVKPLAIKVLEGLAYKARYLGILENA
jgi:hypothetical protein